MKELINPFNKLYKFFGKKIITKNNVVKQIRELAKFMKKNKFSYNTLHHIKPIELRD